MPNSPRHPRRFLAIAFLAIIGCVWPAQILLDLRRGEGIQAIERFPRSPTAANLRSYEMELEEESWLTRSTRPWTQYLRYAALRDPGEKALVGRDGWLFYEPSVRYAISRDPNPPAAWDAPEQAIIAFRDQLAARGIRLIVVPAPNKETIYPDKLTARLAPGQVVLAPRTRQLLDRLRAANVEVIDLFDAFAHARQSPGPDLYLVQDSHWSPAGLSLAAQLVAQRIAAEGDIPPGDLPYTTRPAPVQRLGDVLRMLRSAPLEQNTPPETVPCLQVIHPQTHAPYRDDPASPVLVLGDSFLRIFQTDEPGAAGFTAHLALALRRPVASIISDGGASTLVRQDLYRRSSLLANKRIVVWEFVERDIRFGAEGWQQVPLPPIPAIPAKP